MSSSRREARGGDRPRPAGFGRVFRGEGGVRERRGWWVGGCAGGISKFSSDGINFPVDMSSNRTYRMALLCK